MSVVFIFRRDLRIEDNLALNKAIEYANDNNYKLVCSFCFTDKQISKNTYFSNNSFQFMLESLEELNKNLSDKISFFNDEEFYKKINDVKAISYNLDYTPFSIERDEKIRQYCNKKEIVIITEEDYTLHRIRNVNNKTNTIEPTIKTKSNKAYKKFTPFYNRALKFNVNKPYTISINTKILKKIGDDKILEQYIRESSDSNKEMKGGRTYGLNILEQITDDVFKKYNKNRNVLSHPNSTTKMSAYLKFGCISIREVYHTIQEKYNKKTDLIRQLYWKEFYANITYYYSYILDGMVSQSENMSFSKKYDKIKWNDDNKCFKHWCNGKTGVPLVDAGMNQLNKTGFMHNRLRMITASFLIKDLGVDWRKGEKYFATKLVDYDPASNNGGWQWVAGTGTDANPYFRIFNPWNQMKDYDENCEYIKKWVPELSDIPSNDIHKWYDESIRKKYKDLQNYSPIVDHYLNGTIDKKKMKVIKERYMV